MFKRVIILLLALVFTASAHAQSADGIADRFLKYPETVFVLDNVRLVDGTGAPARDSVSIVIENGRISHIGKAGAEGPKGAKRLDLAGHTVMPGLVMMHEHMNYFSGAYVWDAHPGSVPRLLLAAGVTAARTAGAESPQVDINLKRRIENGMSVGPRLFVTGPYLNGQSSSFLGDNVVETAEEARAVTAYWASRGVNSVKVYSSLSPAALRAVVEEADRRNIHVAGHLGEIGCAEAAEIGIDTIEHSLTSCVKDLGIDMNALDNFRYEAHQAAADRLIAILVAHNVVLVATPPTTELDEPSPEELSMFSPDQLERYEQFVRERPPWLPSAKVMPALNDAHRRFERAFVKAGGRLLIGADASDFGLVPGYANHNAMISLVRAGFSPLQVIKFATLDAAAFLGVSESIGSVAPTRAADLLVVKGAPDLRIEDIRNVAIVFKDGRAFDSEKLRESAKGQIGLH